MRTGGVQMTIPSVGSIGVHGKIYVCRRIMEAWPFETFIVNIAMLGKQEWRLISLLDSLVSQILKACYFPDTEFLKASEGNNPSFIWHSLYTTKGMLAAGLKLQVGTGTNIKVYRPSWLIDDENFFVRIELLPGFETMPVSELMTTDGGSWDRDFVEGLLAPRDETKVLRVPIATHNLPDSVV
ncbi:Polynucleotidyl transferase, Ribonuclease H fold [Gossypium australe]|uniref:Polynucleotidyl transferase, Ribonuclease H fold n=1 Tax=Gossypium australe TaxID=47621 RepID=A0A5B6W1L8_9ROSI|nr:Polynucleotidyl transferase, Ribonuclease H fold [Gossypium australe]